MSPRWGVVCLGVRIMRRFSGYNELLEGKEVESI